VTHEQLALLRGMLVAYDRRALTMTEAELLALLELVVKGGQP
jgi:hypothetical protein